MSSQDNYPDIGQLAHRLGLAVPDDELGLFTKLSEALLDDLSEVRPQSISHAEKPQPQTFERPTELNDPYNAIVRHIQVRGAADGPLSGTRVAVKDSIAIAGLPMSCGSRLFRDFVPTSNSVVVERLLNSGAEIVAQTNMDDLAVSGAGDTSYYGVVRNPFDVSRTAGGSSGGSAAALYYDNIDGSIGTDNGGSIRLPASFCGVVGIKPTFGLVPYTGIPGLDQTIDHVGPMARDVSTTASLLDAIAGRSEGDPRQASAPLSVDSVDAVQSAPNDLSGYRIAVVREALQADLDTQVYDATHSVVQKLERLGAKIDFVSIPSHKLGGKLLSARVIESFSSLLLHAGNGYQWRGNYWPELALHLKDTLPDVTDTLSAQTKIIMLLGTHLRDVWGGAFYAHAQNLSRTLTTDYNQIFETYDAALMPTSPRLPYEDIDCNLKDRVLRGWDVLVNTGPTNITGHPAISLPLAQSDGLPIGTMLVGQCFADEKLLQMARVCERELGWQP